MIANDLRCLLAGLSVFLLASNSLPAQVAAQSRPASRRSSALEFPVPSHDIGRIHDDHPVDWKFPFTNKGTTPVTILDATTTCGCTTAAPDKKTYAPGESGEISATFNPMNRQAQEKKVITVKTDETDTAPIQLELNVFVIPRIGLDQPAVFFGEVRFDAVAANPVKKTITITSRVPTFEIKSATCSDEHFTVKALEPSTGEADGDKVTLHKYDITLVGNLPIGTNRAELRIATNDTLRSLIQIPLVVEAYGALRISPEPLALQMAASNVAVDNFVTIASRDLKPFHISDVKVTGCETMPLTTKVEPAAPGIETAWRVHVMGTSPAGGTHVKGALQLKTDCSAQPDIEVPIQGYVLRRQQQH